MSPSARTLRVGIARPEPAGDLLGEIEATVLRHEVGRRLGGVVLDLRAPRAIGTYWHLDTGIGWGSSVDVALDATSIWGADIPPLASLFARTVSPDAFAVRERMLRHLGVLPAPTRLDDAALDAVDLPLTALDFWIVARDATRVELTRPGLAAIVETEPATADQAIDDAVEHATWVDPAGRDAVFEALVAERDHAVADLERTVAHFRTLEQAAAERIDEIESENEELKRRLARAAVR